MNGDTTRVLLEFLFAVGSTKARELADQLGASGYSTPKKFGDAGGFKSATSTDTESSNQLINVAVEATRESVLLFDLVNKKVVSRLRRAEGIKTGSAILTAVLSSSVVTSVATNAPWSMVAGVATLLAAVLNVLVLRLEGGDANIARRYAEAVKKHEEARLLLLRLTSLDGQLPPISQAEKYAGEATELVLYLNSIRREWEIALTG
jgi:hypothetical protein